MTSRVPKSCTRTKPVRNVPRMLPAVETAYILPTTFPVSERSARRSLITTGVTMPSMMAGTRNSTTVNITIRGMIGKARNLSDTKWSTGSIPMLATPPASSMSPTVDGDGYLSATLPPM